jgi:hypothetical protein
MYQRRNENVTQVERWERSRVLTCGLRPISLSARADLTLLLRHTFQLPTSSLLHNEVSRDSMWYQQVCDKFHFTNAHPDSAYAQLPGSVMFMARPGALSFVLLSLFEPYFERFVHPAPTQPPLLPAYRYCFMKPVICSIHPLLHRFPNKNPCYMAINYSESGDCIGEGWGRRVEFFATWIYAR